MSLEVDTPILDKIQMTAAITMGASSATFVVSDAIQSVQDGRLPFVHTLVDVVSTSNEDYSSVPASALNVLIAANTFYLGSRYLRNFVSIDPEKPLTRKQLKFVDFFNRLGYAAASTERVE